MLKLLRFLKPYKWTFVLIIFITFLQTFGQLLLPTYVANIINNGVLNGDVDYIIDTGIIMLIIAFAAGICSIIVIYLSSLLASNFGKDIRLGLFQKAAYFSVTDFKHIGASSMITRNTNDVHQVMMLFVFALQLLLPAPLMAMGGFYLALRKDTWLTLVLLAAVIIIGVVSYIICMKALPLFMKLQPKMDKINKLLREIITGVRVIRAFNCENHEKSRFSDTATEYAGIAIKVNKIFALFLPVIFLAMNLCVVAILWFGGVRMSGGYILIGDIMAVIGYSYFILAAVMMVAFVLFYVPRAEISARRINEVLEFESSQLENVLSESVQNKQTELSGAVKQAASSSTLSLEFKNVTFAYPDAEEAVLNDISFEVKTGETLAIIGTTGSGKSTLVSLIPRFFDVTAGNILLNGKDIRELSLADLRNKIGYITQKPFIFSGTIRDSVTFGKKELNDEDIERAIRVSQAKEFIEAKEKGLDEPVSQAGANLSGGQKQRLAIARALIRKPDIYIFDDSFSALDYKTDRALRSALSKEIKSSIFIIVAQRISTIKNADKILVLDEGKIAAMGTHKELFKTCDIYKHFALSQLNESELLI